jgi:hypothetical protein
VQERFEVDIKELPEQIDTTTYSTLPTLDHDSTSWLASLAGYFSWFSSKDGYNVGLFRDIVVVCADGSPYQSASACLFGVDLFYS